MLIALDYDGTYTKDPKLWERFIADVVKTGNQIICFTMRYPHEPIVGMSCEVVYTSRKAKKNFSEQAGYLVDIWIDDRPAWLFEDASR